MTIGERIKNCLKSRDVIHRRSFMSKKNYYSNKRKRERERKRKRKGESKKERERERDELAAN